MLQIRILDDGTKQEIWTVNGQIHRDVYNPGPAVITDYPDGRHREEWYENGHRFRQDGPAVIETRADKSYMEAWYSSTDKNGQLHRFLEPAIITTDPSGFKEQRWYQNGVLHRKDGPAVITNYSNGECSKIWYIKGEILKEVLT